MASDLRMAKPLYDWKRYWCSRDGHYSLEDEGFLVDPDSEWGRHYAKHVASFEAMEQYHYHCLVHLGEPGSGKSTTLEQEWEAMQRRVAGTRDCLVRADLREFSTDHHLAAKVFNSPTIERWKCGEGLLHLFLDSLDECQLRIDNISRVLRAEIRELDAGRLRLRIACRTADWPAGLEATLREKWGPGRVGVFELVPLRKKDVILAASTAGIDPAKFLGAIRSAGIAPLANRPVTLRFLMDIYAKSQSLPRGRAALYLEGCRCLAEEASESRRDAGALGDLTPSQRLTVAGRIAAVTMFCNRYAIWNGLYRGKPPEDVATDELVGGREGADATLTTVTREALLETLDTGLFNSRGPERLGWSHQSYAEFLAARHIHESKLPSKKALSFLFHPDGSGKVIPQLRETGAWLASLQPDVFRELIKTDPETLLRSDLTSTSDAERAELAEKLLLSFDTAQLLDDRELRPLYARLNSPELHAVLSPYLRDTAHNLFARHAAVCIADACNLQAPHSDLVNIALDPSQPPLVRRAAAGAVARSGDSQARAALRPLVLGLSGDDPDDELKGYGLQAVWPDHLTGAELFSVLTPRKRRTLLGSYWHFLKSDPGAAVRWAETVGPSRESEPLREIASNILGRALQEIGTPEVIAALARALVSYWNYSLDIPEFATQLLASEARRQRLARALYPFISVHLHGALILMDAVSLRPIDVPWLLGELDSTNENIQKCLAFVIVRCLDPEAVDTFDAILRTAVRNAVLSRELSPFIAVRTLGSPEAEREKNTFFLIHRQYETEKSEPSGPPDKAAFQTALKAPEPNTFFSVWELTLGQISGERSDAEPLPGWGKLDKLTRSQVLASAETYLTRTTFGSDRHDRHWWRDGQFPYYALAAHSALTLIEKEAPSQFRQLDQETWERWVPIVVLEWSSSGLPNPESRIVETAYQQSPANFLKTLDEIIDGENDRAGLLVLHHLDSFWNSAIADLLRSRLQRGRLKPTAYRHLLAKLLDREDAATRKWAQGLLQRAQTHFERMQEQTLGTAIELIAHTSDAGWNIVWPVFQADDDFARSALAGLQSIDPFRSFEFLLKLDAEDVAEFFLWLYPSRLHFVVGKHDQDENQNEEDQKGEIPLAVSMILRGLAYRATPEACIALRQIAQSRPLLAEVPWHLKTAEELARRNTWIPFAPADLLRSISSAAARFIRNGSDLLDVLVESLGRLQESFQGETPAAAELWSDVEPFVDPDSGKKRPIFRPKDEAFLSDYVKRHLDRDLKDRAVVINREVEIRRPMGGAPGERTDIHVTVAVPTSEPDIWVKVTVIIEVKGVWNPDLKTAMHAQLAGRYLRETGFGHGLYLVGWFACPQWDTKDPRSKTRRCASLIEAQQTLDKQAAFLSNSSRHLRAFVLNASLR
jgi:hypothetical protein